MAYLRKPDGQKRGKSATPKPQAPVHHLMPSSPAVVIPPTEDKASHERHIKYLKRECRNVRPNKQVYIALNHLFVNAKGYLTICIDHSTYHQVTKDLMRRTFLFRRKDVEDGVVSMEDLFCTYPPLKSTEEVSQIDCCMFEAVKSIYTQRVWHTIGCNLLRQWQPIRLAIHVATFEVSASRVKLGSGQAHTCMPVSCAVAAQ